MEIDELKATVCAEVDRWGDRLIDVAHEIHDHPELAYEEHTAHDLLTSVLDDAALAPERAAYGVPTAFRAEVGGAGPVVAVLCEYDALPEIGHACGHNVIAAAGLGAGLAVAALADATVSVASSCSGPRRRRVAEARSSWPGGARSPGSTPP